MREISAKEARGKFSSLLKSVEVGGEVVILRRGKQVARLVPPLGVGSRLPSLKEFRASITSPEYLSSIREARADYKMKRVKTHEEVFGK